MPSVSGGDERVRGDVPLVPAVVVEGYLGTIALHGHRVPAVGLTGSSVSDAQIRRRQEHCPALRCVAVGLDGTNRDARPSSSPHRWQSTGGSGSPRCRTDWGRTSLLKRTSLLSWEA